MVAHRLNFFMVFCLFLLAACGKPSEKNLCDGVACEFGVCDPLSGDCVNPGTCDDDAPCLNGFSCEEEQCIASFACGADDSCDRGVCEEGACVNPDRCDVNTDCVPGWGCDGDRCIEDLCDQVECDRGVCEKATGECVNAAVCTAQTEETACLEDFHCYDQNCVDEATVCAELDCERGVCSVADRACVNAESCGGDDQNCLEGSFCNAVDQCQQNVCDANMVSCPRGVCDPTTGNCVNADECAAADECTDGFYCVDGGCVEQMEACEVCVGSQTCSYDDGALNVFCEESEDGCVTTVDCVGSRECMDGECADPVACVADDLEPNDSLGEATDWFGLVPGTVQGTICGGDADFFSFDVSNDPEFTGTLIAIVNIATADLGVGLLELEVLDESGATVASTTSTATDGVVRVEYTIGNINQGIYTLAIRDAGDVGLGGIEYSLFMDLADPGAVAACENADLLAASVSGDTSASTSNTLSSTCVNDASATEDVYRLDVTEPSYATIELVNAQFDGALSLRNQCEADASEVVCANDALGIATESISARLQPGSYFVLVEGVSGSEQGTYDLNVDLAPVICDQSDNSCVDMNTASVCNSRGTGFDEQSCDSGCDANIGVCIRETADVCTTAVDATGGYTGTISLGLLTNDYDPGTTCVPASFGTSTTSGADAVFQVSLAPDDVVYAQATPLGFDDVSWYITDDCSGVESACLDGVNDGFSDAVEEIVLQNTTGSAKDFWLFLDSAASANGDVDVDIFAGQQICTPGEQQCNGAMLETCNAGGTGYSARNCAFGCDAMTNACVPPPNDVCGMGAIDVSAGGQFTGLIDDYADDYSDPSACTGFSAGGADAVFSLVGTVGDVVTVTLDAPYDTSLYAVTSCSDIAGTCLDGSDQIGAAEEIQFVVRDTDPIYIIADAFSTSPSGTFTLDVTIQTPDCTDYGAPVTCQADGTTLQYCDDLGFFADYMCATTCSGAACDEPSGDRCFDAIPLADGASFTGSYGDYTNTLDPGVGTCILASGQSQPGKEAVFAVDLAAGDLLTADLTTAVFGASMYVLSDCGDARNTCEWAAPRSDTMEFFANATGTYYLVVDSTSSFDTEAFTLDIDIQSGFVCQPGGSICDDQSSTVTICNDDGTAIRDTLVCANNCTQSGFCNAPTTANDTCLDALLVTGSVRFMENYDRFTNEFDPGVSVNTCDLDITDGPDAIYEVQLAASDVVEVNVDDFGAFGNPIAYIVTDCADPVNTCVASDEQTSTARAGYVSVGGETVYVVVDNDDDLADHPFSVDIEVRPSACTPGLNQCSDPNTREYCDEFGTLQTEDCYFGCNAGACEPPTNDTCSMPVDATGGGTFTMPIDDFTNDYDPTSSGCTGWAAAGPDAMFMVSAAAGDIISVQLQGASMDSSLYVTSTCGDVTTCLAGADSTGTGSVEEVMFSAPAAGDYFIYADVFGTTSTGDFTLDVTQETPICTSGDTACDAAGQNIEVCNALGTAYDVYPCDASGCVPGADTCNNATGEYCVDALDANGGGQFTGSYANFSNDYDLDPTQSCTSWEAPGPDIAYYVDLTMGQTLSATLNGTDDTSLYVVSECSDPTGSCLVGDDQFGSNESITYVAPADERVFIIVDAFDEFAASTYTLDVTIN